MVIEIFGLEDCSYCKAAIALCEEMGLKYTYISLENNEDLAVVATKDFSKFRTVPQIFIGERHIGGYTELKDYIKNG